MGHFLWATLILAIFRLRGIPALKLKQHQRRLRRILG
jgi:hypothetical protein